ncbi:MAG: hypothetical protein B6U89_02315 [Desulfurococcales archaeon ex4484_58]|nr:MAG: hypothetical protein B6U89_02315 [Desulfurococcales archaeon ex4484_58]
MYIYDEYVRDFLKRIVKEYSLLNARVNSYSNTRGRDTVLETHIIPPEWFRLPSSEYAIARGKEYMMECRLYNKKAHVFTSSPYIGAMNISRILDLKLDSILNRTIFYCTLNVVLRYLGLIDKTIHCRGDTPVKCAREMMRYIVEKYGGEKLLVIGYQPAIVREATRTYRRVYVTDMDPSNIGRRIGDVEIMDHTRNIELISSVDIVLATGSTVINSTLWPIYEAVNEAGNKLILYGVTGAGVSYVMGIERLCMYGE